MTESASVCHLVLKVKGKGDYPLTALRLTDAVLISVYIGLEAAVSLRPVVRTIDLISSSIICR